jgi:hypothetical protein
MSRAAPIFLSATRELHLLAQASLNVVDEPAENGASLQFNEVSRPRQRNFVDGLDTTRPRSHNHDAVAQ